MNKQRGFLAKWIFKLKIKKTNKKDEMVEVQEIKSLSVICHFFCLAPTSEQRRINWFVFICKAGGGNKSRMKIKALKKAQNWTFTLQAVLCLPFLVLYVLSSSDIQLLCAAGHQTNSRISENSDVSLKSLRKDKRAFCF